jgi:hypothetical protein
MSIVWNRSLEALRELSESTVTANLLADGIDEIFSRTDSSGLSHSSKTLWAIQSPLPM